MHCRRMRSLVRGVVDKYGHERKTIDTNTNQFIKVYHILDKMQYKITKIFKVMKRPSYGDNLTSYLANET